jgi:fucose permease
VVPGDRDIWVRLLVSLMFMMFAMTTDSVGVIIPQVIREFGLTLSAAVSFQYAMMIGIGLSGLVLGHLADRLGRKIAIVGGLTLFAVSAGLMSKGASLGQFELLLFVSGASIGSFKTGALALIGDISRSPVEHTRTMNLVEGFFGVGAIIGPLILIEFLALGVTWRGLYVVAGVGCFVLAGLALWAPFPTLRQPPGTAGPALGTTALLQDPFAVGFSLAAFLYVATECAIYVWMPTLLADYHGPAQLLSRFALPLFFILRAAGRFLGSWLLSCLEWSAVLAVMSLCILLCFSVSVIAANSTVYLLPLCGLFMSVIYPTLNSKGMSCFPRSDHGRVAGILLFFTCAGAAFGPWAMGAVSDYFGQARQGFVLATGYAAALTALLALNWGKSLTQGRLAARQHEYAHRPDAPETSLTRIAADAGSLSSRGPASP